MKKRFNNQKERITMFSCIYKTLKHGKVFYIPNKSVPNTNEVKADYIVHKEISGKGMNLGIKFYGGSFIPFTILISKAKDLLKYTENMTVKIVSKLIIKNIDTGDDIEVIAFK